MSLSRTLRLVLVASLGLLLSLSGTTAEALANRPGTRAATGRAGSSLAPAASHASHRAAAAHPGAYRAASSGPAISHAGTRLGHHRHHPMHRTDSRGVAWRPVYWVYWRYSPDSSWVCYGGYYDRSAAQMVVDAFVYYGMDSFLRAR